MKDEIKSQTGDRTRGIRLTERCPDCGSGSWVDPTDERMASCDNYPACDRSVMGKGWKRVGLETGERKQKLTRDTDDAPPGSRPTTSVYRPAQQCPACGYGVFGTPVSDQRGEAFGYRCEHCKSQWRHVTLWEEEPWSENLEAVRGTHGRDEEFAGAQALDFAASSQPEGSALPSILSELAEANETIDIQHRLMVSAEGRGAGKAQQEIRTLRAERDELAVKLGRYTLLTAERDDAKVALEAARGIFTQITQSLTKERDELTAWKEAAMTVMAPYQEIGAVLGVPLGTSVHDKILPGITALLARVDELEHELMVAKASAKLNSEYARAFEHERDEALKLVEALTAKAATSTALERGKFPGGAQ